MFKARFDPKDSPNAASRAWTGRGVALALAASMLALGACADVAEVRQAWEARRGQLALTLDEIKRHRSQLADSVERPPGLTMDQRPSAGARRHRIAAALKGLEQSLNDVHVRLAASERTIEVAFARGAGEARAAMDAATASISQDIAGLQTNITEIERELRNET